LQWPPNYSHINIESQAYSDSRKSKGKARARCDSESADEDEEPPLEPDESDSERSANEYVVEKIIDSRADDDDGVEYFIKWKGFPDNQSTWEHSDDLTAPKLVAQFLGTIPRSQSPRRQSHRAGALDKS
jgi:hypothetical protein